MKFFFSIAFTSLIAAIFFACNQPAKQTTDMQPPDAMKRPKQLSAHGDLRVDNYYWMRLSDAQKSASQPDQQTQQVLNYLKEENAYTDTMLSHTDSLQETLFNEMVGRLKKNEASVPYFKNGYWYYNRYEKGKEYPIYCRKKQTLDAPEEIILNVNELAEGHSYYNATGLEISPDNNILAFGEDTLSRRIYTIRFKNLETGEFLNDQIANTTGSGAWANDNQTYFYTSKNKTTLLSEKIHRHKLGTSPESDEMVYHEKDPSYYIGVYKSRSEDYVIIYNSSTLSSDYQILKADNPEGTFKQFTPREDIHEYDITHFNGKFYIRTNWKAKNFRLMATPEDATEKTNWEEIIPHREDVLINEVELFADHTVLQERQKGFTKIRIINRNTGDDHYISFDEPAYTVNIGQNPEPATKQLRFVYNSLTTPRSVFDYNMDTKERELKKRKEVVGGHNPEDYATERLYAKARDGEQIPISMVYRKGFQKDGQSPLLLYGYGSYGATMDPRFRSHLLSLLDRGFAFAIAHVRGSQMMGREWYEDGKMHNKKNTFYDFIDCAEHLINENYTNPDKLYGMGGSAGGLLIGAVANMAPEKFDGLVAAVPFVDVVTTMSDPSIPLTTNEYDEWGNPENKEDYTYMKSYSPYDNVQEQKYPNMLVTTGLFDSQVQYWEPAKWVAKLRDHKTDDNLLLLKTNMGAGHGGASGRYQRYRETALEYAFLLDMAGMVK